MEVDVTPGQCDGGHSSSQSVRKSGQWDVHPSIGMDDRQVQEEDEWRSMIYNNRDLTKRGRPGRRRPGGKGERPLRCERSWGFQSSGEGSLLPRTLSRPILCVFPPLRTSRRLIRAQLPDPLSTNSLNWAQSKNCDPTIIFCQYLKTKFICFSSNFLGFEFVIYFFVKFFIM